VHGIHSGVRGYVSEAKPAPPDLFEWLLDLVIRIPELDIGGNTAWYVRELEKALGPVPISWLAQAVSRRIAIQKGAGKRSGFLPSGDARLTQFVRPLESGQIEAERDAVRSLLDLRHESGGLGYYLPQYLADIDPHGLLVPQLVAQIAQAHVGNYEELHMCARIGGAYALGADSWSVIAVAVVRGARSFDKQARVSIFLALGDPRPRTWSGDAGKVAPVFVSAVEDARLRERANQTPELAEFWRWRLDTAEAELARQVEELKDEDDE
jgi:hypothetical protein